MNLRLKFTLDFAISARYIYHEIIRLRCIIEYRSCSQHKLVFLFIIAVRASHDVMRNSVLLRSCQINTCFEQESIFEMAYLKKTYVFVIVLDRTKMELSASSLMYHPFPLARRE